MKTLKLFFIIVIATITMVSCEKDEPAPTPNDWDNILISISNEMEANNKYLSDNIFTEVRDTQFVVNPETGLIDIDPETGLPLWNSIDIVYNDYANAKRMSENKATNSLLLLAQKIWEWQDANPNKRGKFSSWVYEDCFIVIEKVDGKSVQEDISTLNELGKLVIQYPTKPPIYIIRDECVRVTPKAKKASIVHLEKMVIEGPSQKMALIREYEAKMASTKTEESVKAIQDEFTKKSQSR